MFGVSTLQYRTDAHIAAAQLLPQSQKPDPAGTPHVMTLVASITAISLRSAETSLTMHQIRARERTMDVVFKVDMRWLSGLLHHHHKRRNKTSIADPGFQI